MESGCSPTAPGGSPPVSDCRIVLLGKTGAGKSSVAKAILRDKKLKEEREQCVLHEGEHAGRRICVVDTPGWDRVSIDCTTEKIKNKIAQSVTLCSPGPHALILVLPVKHGDVPPANELKAARQHVELLSERVWNYTMVLFFCDGDVEESAISEYIQNAEQLLEKCRGRHYVMRHRESETQVPTLLKKIENMVEENSHDYFIPQVYYDMIQSKMAQKQEDEKQGEEKSDEKGVLRQRRGSLQGFRPTMTEGTGDSESQTERTETTKHKNQDQLPWYYIKPVIVILMAFVGALLGSVAGAQYGTMGAVVGIVIGFVVLMLLSLWLLNVIT